MDERIENALFNECFPCNPLPFLNYLFEQVKTNGTDWIKSDSAKKVLWILMSQSYGQMARINLCDEWDRLHKMYNSQKP